MATQNKSVEVTPELFGWHPHFQRDGFVSFLSVLSGVRPVAWLTGEGLKIKRIEALCKKAGLLCIQDRRAGKDGFFEKEAGPKNQVWVVREEMISNVGEVRNLLAAKSIHVEMISTGLLGFPQCCYEAYRPSSTEAQAWVTDPESRPFRYAIHVPCESCVADLVNSPTAKIEQELKDAIGSIEWD